MPFESDGGSGNHKQVTAYTGPQLKRYISTGTETQVTTVGVTDWLLEGILLQNETAGTVKVYDDDDGTAGIFLDLPVGSPVGAYPCGVRCSTGIRVVTTEADKILVVYRKV